MKVTIKTNDLYDIVVLVNDKEVFSNSVYDSSESSTICGMVRLAEAMAEGMGAEVVFEEYTK